MQGGIDLSVAGGLSLYVVIVTKYPAGDNSRLLPAIGIAFLAAIAAGSLNGFLIGRMRLNPIVATLGTNALLFGAVLWYTAGIPTTTTARLARVGGGLWLGIPAPVYFAVAATAVVTAVVKLTPAGPALRGRRRERDRRPHGRAPGEAPPGRRLRVGAAPLLPRGGAARRHRQPADGATRATTTSCRPWRRSCSAARRCSAVAATSSRPRSPRSSSRSSTSSCSRSACTYATRTLVQAAALAVGVALYTDQLAADSRRRLSDASPSEASRLPDRPPVDLTRADVDKSTDEEKGGHAR